jgi:hypothetical protein
LVGLRSLLKTEEIVKEESNNENMLKGVVIGRSLLSVLNVLWLGNE